MSIAEKLTTIAENQQKIATRYFKTSFVGDGTSKASFAIPFIPDMVVISGTSAYIDTMPGNFMSIAFDMRSAWKYAGRMAYSTKAGSIGTGVIKTSSALASVSYADGVFTWNAPALPATWSPATRYSVMAVKFPEQTVKTLVEEEIVLLPDAVPSDSNGTLVYNSAQINDTFTTDEWAELIAQKPNWTFSME